MSSGERDGTVHLSGVRRTFRDGGRTVTVLDGVDLTVASGEFVAVTGESGSGKSTLLAVVGGMDRGFAGSAVVCGTDLGRASESELNRFRNRNVGFVFQEFHLLPHLSVLDNLSVALVLRDEPRGETEQRARSLAERLGLSGHLRTPARVLSSGEKQRVALGRALAGDPRLVLADEPTASLDRQHAAEVLSMLEASVRQAGATLLAVTHDERVAERADRVLRLERGRLSGHA